MVKELYSSSKVKYLKNIYKAVAAVSCIFILNMNLRLKKNEGPIVFVCAVQFNVKAMAHIILSNSLSHS